MSKARDVILLTAIFILYLGWCLSARYAICTDGSYIRSISACMVGLGGR